MYLLFIQSHKVVYAGCKGTKFLANHNWQEEFIFIVRVVYAGCKGTKFLANHNDISAQELEKAVVYAGCKGTKFLANHNGRCHRVRNTSLFMLDAKVLNF